MGDVCTVRTETVVCILFLFLKPAKESEKWPAHNTGQFTRTAMGIFHSEQCSEDEQEKGKLKHTDICSSLPRSSNGFAGGPALQGERYNIIGTMDYRYS